MSAAIGLADALNNDSDPFAGGQSCAVVDYLRRNGGHDSLAVGKCMVEADRNDPDAVRRLGLLYDSYKMELAVMPSSDTPAAVETLRAGYVAILKQHEPWVDELNPPLPPNVLSDFFGYRRDRFIFALTSYQCYNAGKPEPLGFLPACVQNYNHQATTADIRALIDARLLLPDAQPVEIAYCSAILLEAAYPGADRSSGAKLPCPPRPDGLGEGGPHASLVIGRRPGDAGRCQYLVRNSWGSGCAGGKIHALPGGPKGASVQPKGDIYAPQWQCENGKGDIWLDAETLANSVFGVSYLDGSPASSGSGEPTADAQSR
jgi:hypothetical protein